MLPSERVIGAVPGRAGFVDRRRWGRLGRILRRAAGQEPAGSGHFPEPDSTSFHVEGRSLLFQFGVRNRKIVLRYADCPEESARSGCLTQRGRGRVGVKRRRGCLKGIPGFPQQQEQRPPGPSGMLAPSELAIRRVPPRLPLSPPGVAALREDGPGPSTS